MSWKAENWLAENCDLAFGVPRALLFAMANQANDEGSLMAKNGTYMKRLNVTERSVQRATAALVKGGWIKKIPDYSEDGRQLCNVYRIVMPPNVGGGRVTPASPPQGDPHVTLPVTPSVTPRVTSAVTPIKNQTDNPHGESLTPPTPLTGGGGLTVTDHLEAITQRLWTERQVRLTTRARREAKHRLRAGESPTDVFAWLSGPPSERARAAAWIEGNLPSDANPQTAPDLRALFASLPTPPIDLLQAIETLLFERYPVAEADRNSRLERMRASLSARSPAA